MKEFPSCFGENGVQVAYSSSSSSSSSSSTNNNNRAAPQNLVTCVYHYQSRAFSGFITVTWIKHLMAQGLSIGIEDSTKQSLCKVDIKPWLFSKRKGFKNVILNSTTVDIHWDLSSAKFGPSPEPLQGFYLSITLDQELCLLLGDSPHKKTDPTPRATFVAKREHIFGKRLYNSKAQFYDKGKLHDIRIEYDPNESFGKRLMIYIDKKLVLQVAHLKWKFRGNQPILVDGLSVEVYWDVYSWLFDSVIGNAIFLFRTGEKPWIDRSLFESPASKSTGRQRSYKDNVDSLSHGFSLVLCAWKNE